MRTVVAALIEKDGKFLVAKRKKESELGGFWEFPGGKVEAGESDAEALEREILEEFNSLVEIEKLLATAEINSETVIKLYACRHKLGAYRPLVHEEVSWVASLSTLNEFDLAPADQDLLDQIVKDTRKPSLHELKTGNAYKNEDIMRIFLVSGQGGMRKSNRANALVLFALHNTGNPYEDKWDDNGVMHYTGMGLSGDQSIDYAQNKTLAESASNGVSLHLFESFEPNEYIYRGEVSLNSEPYMEKQKDELRHERWVVKFPIKSL